MSDDCRDFQQNLLQTPPPTELTTVTLAAASKSSAASSALPIVHDEIRLCDPAPRNRIALRERGVSRESAIVQPVMFTSEHSSASMPQGAPSRSWQPLMLIPEGGGWWRLPAPLRPGLYRFNLRTDGGLWRTPPGLPSEPDDFGSRIAVLVVPGG